MENSKIREFLQQTAVKTGAIVMASALVLTSGTWSGIFRNDMQFVSEAELPIFVDLEGEEDIDGNEIPSGNAPKVTKSTKTTKSTKKVKLKEKAKKTYTKKSKAKKETKTSKKVTDDGTTTIKTETSTSLTSKFKKGSNVNTQITTVTTVTTTTVEANQAAQVMVVSSEETAAAPAAASGQIAISAIAPKVDARVANAYTTLGFTIGVDSSVNYSGVFDARKRSITLKKAGDTVYHELGHFVAFIAGNVDTSTAFKQVFEAEKDLYTEFNKEYVLQNSSEYFAESFKNYTLAPGVLKKERPLTYDAVEAALGNITDTQVTKVQTVYRAVWGA